LIPRSVNETIFLIYLFLGKEPLKNALTLGKDQRDASF